MHICGAKCKKHCFNISRDIFYSVSYHFLVAHQMTSISLKRKKIFQKEKCHSSVFRKVFEISRKTSNIHGQAYHGASVMSSGKAEVQAKIKEISPLALFTHCYSHCLNLSIAATCKVTEVRNLIGLIRDISVFE